MHKSLDHRALVVNTEQKPEYRQYNCKLCSEQHKLYNCDKFIKMAVSERKVAVSRLRLCFNCLNYGHQVKDCKFSGCPKCNRKHNSKLHEEQGSTDISVNKSVHSSSGEENAVLCAELYESLQEPLSMQVMLATASVNVYDSKGQPQLCRAVLDSGSQLNLIT